MFHLHRALEALHTPHRIRVVVTGRQEIGDEHQPVGVFHSASGMNVSGT